MDVVAEQRGGVSARWRPVAVKHVVSRKSTRSGSRGRLKTHPFFPPLSCKWPVTDPHQLLNPSTAPLPQVSGTGRTAKNPERAQTIAATARVPVEREKKGGMKALRSAAMTPFSSRHQSVTSEADRSKVTPHEPPPHRQLRPHHTQDGPCEEDDSQRSTCSTFTHKQEVQRRTEQLSISRKGNI